MTATFKSSTNEITSQFRDAWLALSPQFNGGVAPPVEYEGMPFDKPISGPWARLTIRQTSGRTATFPTSGQSRYEKRGIIIVSIFSPVQDMTDTSLGTDLVTVAEDAYEGQSTLSQVQFTDVSASYIGVSVDDDVGGPWHQHNMTASFDYDQLSPRLPEGDNLFVGLAGHWRLNELTGTALDSHGAFPLTVSGGTIPSFADGKVGAARGVYQALEIHQRAVGIGDAMDLTGGLVDVSFFCWARQPVTPAIDPGIVSVWGTTIARQGFFFRLLTDVTGDFLHFGMGDGAGGVVNVFLNIEPFPIDEWVAVGFSYDSATNTVSLYKKLENEVSILVGGSGVTGGFQNTERHTFALGGSQAGITSWLGYLDSASWWNGRVLGKAEFDFLALGVDLNEFDAYPQI